MFLGSAIIIFGTIIQATCKGLAQFMVGRFILGFGVALTATAGPSYVSELAHPAYRGIMTGMFNVFWFVGGIPGTFVPAGTAGIHSSASWRIPIWLQCVFAGIVVICAPFLPETPRWLMSQDRHEEALDVLVSAVGENGPSLAGLTLHSGKISRRR
jgi:MFS family permease